MASRTIELLTTLLNVSYVWLSFAGCLAEHLPEDFC